MPVKPLIFKILQNLDIYGHFVTISLTNIVSCDARQWERVARVYDTRTTDSVDGIDSNIHSVWPGVDEAGISSTCGKTCGY